MKQKQETIPGPTRPGASDGGHIPSPSGETKAAAEKKKGAFGMFLVAIGIVYGDIGTSPLYVMKSILEGNGGLSGAGEDFIVGALSLVIWTITLLTTVKYVVIAMKADNNGEGGIFSLYSLVKNCGKWLILPAMVGGAALLADGVLTPAVTVTTAVEGLRSIEVMDRFLGAGQGKVVLITLVIIAALFCVQRAGTSRIGSAFGPVMLVWFSFLALGGAVNVVRAPVVLKAFNPLYAIRLLYSPYNLKGVMILGSVFLAATGAEALYSDMGHVGRENIYRSWPFVKGCLILNYLGQGAWILSHRTDSALAAVQDLNPFFMMLPEALRPVAVLLGAAAAVIASQALITGSYTLVSEAVHLDLMPHMEVFYPSRTKGQLFIPLVNRILWVGCTAVVLYFRSGSRIESAYGLAITATMLMTTVLLAVYLHRIRGRLYLAVPMLLVFGAVECFFFVSSLSKFTAGGYVTVIIALLLFLVMLIWQRGSALEDRFRTRVRVADYLPQLRTLHEDVSLQPAASNIVYLEKDLDLAQVDRDVLYSILDRDPKRADAYWFVRVNVTDEPDTLQYAVESYGTDFVYSVRMDFGFRQQQAVNVYISRIIRDLRESGELPAQERRYSMYGASDVGNFKFCMLRKTVPAYGGLSTVDQVILRAKYAIRRAIGTQDSWYGLSTVSRIDEEVPLFLGDHAGFAPMERV